MNDSFKNQLGKIRPQVSKREELEGLFTATEVSTQESSGVIDWNDPQQVEIAKELLGKYYGDADLCIPKEPLKEERKSRKYVNYSIGACLLSLAASCVLMVKRDCTNPDDSPKFRV